MTPPYDPQYFALQEALAGKYSLDSELGRGGMGVVYLAQDVRLDRPVALKVLPQHLAAQPALRERFLQEARTAAKLSHPHIVPIHSVDEVGEFVFFAMSYVAGETLGQRVASRGPLPPSEAVRLLKEVGWALAYAHSQGVVHRDVKSDNILLEEETGRALVADFGIAGLLDTTDPVGIGEIVGTVEFMSPEQANGEAIDARSDIYSLGVVAFHALSATLPFHGDNAIQILEQHRDAPPPPLTTVAKGIPSRLARTVDRCLVKEPDGRFDSAKAFAEAVDATGHQRKDVSVPVRMFMTDPIDLPGDGPLYFTFAGLMSAVLVGIGVDEPVVWPVLAVFAITILGPPGIFVPQRIRRLLATGHTHQDVVLGFKQELERRREELAYTFGVEAGRIEKAAAGVFKVSAGTFLGSIGVIAAAVFGVVDPGSSLFGWIFGGSATLALASGTVESSLRRRRIDGKAERRYKFWKGPLGKLLFKLSGLGVKRKAIAARPTHRPTELQIGFAVDGLYEALPKETRKAVGDVPAVARQLEGDAQRLRETIEHLNEAHAAARIAGQEVPDDLREARDHAERHLAEAVASLENIRLGLLRLTAGAGNVQSFTTDLAAAKEVDEHIDRLMAGWHDVELVLRNSEG